MRSYGAIIHDIVTKDGKLETFSSKDVGTTRDNNFLHSVSYIGAWPSLAFEGTNILYALDSQGARGLVFIL